MSRNYQKENEWLKQNYCRIEGRIDKNFGNRFKLYLKDKNISFNEWLENKIKGDGIMKTVGTLWNDKDIQIVEQDGEMYALYGWNGEAYYECWKVLDEKGLNRVDEDTEYILKPIDVETESGDFETLYYEISSK